MESKSLDLDKLARVNHLAGELRLLAARLSAARIRVLVAALILLVTLPLEWAFGADFFAEFARDENGQMGDMDVAMVALKGLMLLSTVVILKYVVLELSDKVRRRLLWVARSDMGQCFLVSRPERAI